MDYIFTVTRIVHSNHECDISCLEFLALLATTEKGANFVHARLSYFTSRANLTQHGSPSWAAFGALVKAVLLNMQATLDKREARFVQVVSAIF